MLQFVIGLVIGVMIGFITCAVLSINNFDKDSKRYIPDVAEEGENDAGK